MMKVLELLKNIIGKIVYMDNIVDIGESIFDFFRVVNVIWILIFLLILVNILYLISY